MNHKLNFRRVKKHGVNQKVRKIWRSPEGYRIIWRREVFGVKVRAAYQACVRTIIPGNFQENGIPVKTKVIWDFVNNKKRLYKTMNAAVVDCEKHFQTWTKAKECTGIRALCELLGFYPFGLPKWVSNQLYRRVWSTLLDTSPNRRKHTNDKGDSNIIDTVKMPQDTESIEPKRRKTRSDKGKKRGPRKKKLDTDTNTDTNTDTIDTKPKKRKTRSDKGKKRGPRKPKGTT